MLKLGQNVYLNRAYENPSSLKLENENIFKLKNKILILLDILFNCRGQATKCFHFLLLKDFFLKKKMIGSALPNQNFHFHSKK